MIPTALSVLILVCNLCICISKSTIRPSADLLRNIIHNEDNRKGRRVEYATQMLSYMNVSVQPCDDFYEYACGNWKNTIQERQTDKRRVNILDINYKLGEIVEDILQRSDINDVAPEYSKEFELAKKFYHKCIDTKLYPMRKSSEYLEILKQIGGFPALEPQWNATEFSWFSMSAHLSRYGVQNLIKEEIFSEYPFMPYFSLPTFGFDIEFHYDNIEDLSSNTYIVNKKRMYDIMTLYGVTEHDRDIIISDIFKFLTAILNVMGKFEADEYKCGELSETLDDSDVQAITQQWMTYFDIVWEGKFRLLDDSNRPCSFFYHNLNKIAEDHKEAVANYLSLKFLYHMDARLLDPKFHKDYCVFSVKKSMRFFFDHLFMKIVFNKEISDDVIKMAREIQQSLRRVLQQADWLDVRTKKAALVKESTMGLNVGRYEDAAANKRILNELKNLKFINGSYEANRINLMLFKSYMTRYQGLHQEYFNHHTKPMQMMLGMQVNGFYHPIDNSLYIAGGVLQPPTYHQTWPNSLKYGTVGFILGHEFTHGFDAIGANYDHNGKHINWWSQESRKIFHGRAQCFVDFYSNYTVPEINRRINGKLTKNENIADAGGIRIALMAYRRYLHDKRKKLGSKWRQIYKEEQMPGLDLTPEQLFFLGAAQIWCSSYKEANYWEELSNYHTIDKYRVLGFVSNNEEFSKVYKCPLGSNMNPIADKCQVW